MPDIYLYQGEATPSDIRLSDPTVLSGALTIDFLGHGIVTAESFGSLDVTLDIVSASISTTEAIGSPQLTLTIESIGIPTEEALGSDQISLDVGCVGIDSAEAFGLPAIDLVVIALTIDMIGISSQESFGSPNIVISAKEARKFEGITGGAWPRRRRPKKGLSIIEREDKEIIKILTAFLEAA